jgi:hypothetical protein
MPSIDAILGRESSPRVHSGCISPRVWRRLRPFCHAWGHSRRVAIQQRLSDSRHERVGDSARAGGRLMRPRFAVLGAWMLGSVLALATGASIAIVPGSVRPGWPIAPPSVGPAQDGRWAEEARRHYFSHNWAALADSARRWIESAPDSAVAGSLLGLAQLRLGQLPGAGMGQHGRMAGGRSAARLSPGARTEHGRSLVHARPGRLCSRCAERLSAGLR